MRLRPRVANSYQPATLDNKAKDLKRILCTTSCRFFLRPVMAPAALQLTKPCTTWTSTPPHAFKPLRLGRLGRTVALSL